MTPSMPTAQPCRASVKCTPKSVDSIGACCWRNERPPSSAAMVVPNSGAAVARAVDDALLAGDPRALRVEACDREERPLRPGVLPLPGLAPVRGVEDAAQLAHHPAVAVGREAGAEEALADLAQGDGRGARRGGERHEDEEHG